MARISVTYRSRLAGLLAIGRGVGFDGFSDLANGDKQRLANAKEDDFT
jgi:hypothetical protein